VEIGITRYRDGKVFRILEDIATLVAWGSLIPPSFRPPN
jgi:hypothetical protein